jgi:hypothetical protein
MGWAVVALALVGTICEHAKEQSELALAVTADDVQRMKLALRGDHDLNEIGCVS